MRILCLHGHTQTGPVFDRKTHRLQQHIRSAVSDRLDYLDEIQRERSGSFKDPDVIDTHAWFRLHEDDPPRGLLESIDRVADILRTEGPFDGIICFSQGSVVGGMVASLLEGPRRRQRFEEYAAVFPDAVRYPEAYKTLTHPPFKFGITYGAYMGVSPVFSAGAHAIPVGNVYHEAVVDIIRSVSDGSYFGLPTDGVPSLEHHDTPEKTPLHTPLLDPSLPSTVPVTPVPYYEPTILASQKLDRWRKSWMPPRPITTRRGRPPLSARWSTSSSNTSSAGSPSSAVTRSRASTAECTTSEKNTQVVVTVVEDDMMLPYYERGDWQELLVSDLLNEMFRRQDRLVNGTSLD
ncbi:serine hydrolase-domain-containing protein [Aspergillus aurantiobrunneus]